MMKRASANMKSVVIVTVGSGLSLKGQYEKISSLMIVSLTNGTVSFFFYHSF